MTRTTFCPPSRRMTGTLELGVMLYLAGRGREGSAWGTDGQGGLAAQRPAGLLRSPRLPPLAPARAHDGRTSAATAPGRLRWPSRRAAGPGSAAGRGARAGSTAGRGRAGAGGRFSDVRARTAAGRASPTEGRPRTHADGVGEASAHDDDGRCCRRDEYDGGDLLVAAGRRRRRRPSGRPVECPAD